MMARNDNKNKDGIIFMKEKIQREGAGGETLARGGILIAT